MIKTAKFELKQLNEQTLNQPNNSEFQECNFPKLKSTDDKKGVYIFYGTEVIKKVEANTAYEAVRKANLEKIKKVVYTDSILETKKIFTPEELINR